MNIGSENNGIECDGLSLLAESMTKLTNLKTLELTRKIRNVGESATSSVHFCGYRGLVQSSERMTQLTRLNLLGNSINVNSRKFIMDQSRVKEGTLQIMLSPCLVFVGQSVSFNTKDIEAYLNAGCCVYRSGYNPIYAPQKISPGLVSVLGNEGVRIIGKQNAQFFGPDRTSTILGDCYCPAGKKGYYEVTVNECSEGKVKLGFCSKNLVINMQESADEDMQTWGKQIWGVLLDQLQLASLPGCCRIMPDRLRSLTISEGDVIGLGCEVNLNDNQPVNLKAQLPWEQWEAGSVSGPTDENYSRSASEHESKNQLLSAEEIFSFMPEVWVSDSVSNREDENGGKISIWIYKKTAETKTDTVTSEESEPVLVIQLPTGLLGVCPAFQCDTGALVCNLGGNGCEKFCQGNPPTGFEAMGSFPPPPISPNTPGVFTVLHTPTSLPIPARSLVGKSTR